MKTKLAAFALTALLSLSASQLRAEPSDCKADADCVSADPSLIGTCNHWQCKYYPAPEPQPEPKSLPDFYQCPDSQAKFHQGVCDDITLPDHQLFLFECLTMKEMVKLDPTLNPDDTVCCLVVEDSELQYNHFMNEPDYRAAKMAECGGKMPATPSDLSDEIAAQIEKCGSIDVNVGGGVSQDAQVNVCCNVVNNGGSIDDIVEACSNTSFLPAAPSGKSPASSETTPTAGDTEGENGTVATSTDNLHVAGGTGGCSLIR